MKAEERKALESNDLASGAATLLGQVKTGHLASPWGYRVIGLTVSALLIGGLVWYLVRESGKAASHQWAELASATPTDLEALATTYKDTVPGRVARLEQARVLLGADGIGKLTASDRDAQNKGIANIEQARDLFTQLAGDFAKDKTLHATCLAEAAAAELALLGVPKTANGTDSRGTVQAAADLYARAAQAIGATTPAGELFTKKAAELTANDAMLTKAALDLYSRTMPLPSFSGGQPGEGIKTPTSLAPKTDLTPGEGVKAPPTPIAPPTPPAGAPAAPTPPPVTAPVAPATPTTNK